MLIDSHCHLNLLSDPEEVLRFAEARGVTRFLCVGVNLDTFSSVYQFAQIYPKVDCSFGIHPDEDQRAYTLEELLPQATLPKVVAIGETGLDFYRDYHVDNQLHNFKLHIEMARQLQKPLIIHTRAASAKTIEWMRTYQAQEVGGVMHCFTEDWATAEQALDLGFYISISGIVTFKNAVQVQEVAKKVPLDRLLVETDSPYLAPVPYRGKPNQPGYVKEVAEYVATLRGISFAKLAAATTQNYLTLFHPDHAHV